MNESLINNIGYKPKTMLINDKEYEKVNLFLTKTMKENIINN